NADTIPWRRFQSGPVIIARRAKRCLGEECFVRMVASDREWRGQEKKAPALETCRREMLNGYNQSLRGPSTRRPPPLPPEIPPAAQTTDTSEKPSKSHRNTETQTRQRDREDGHDGERRTAASGDGQNNKGTNKPVLLYPNFDVPLQARRGATDRGVGKRAEQQRHDIRRQTSGYKRVNPPREHEQALQPVVFRNRLRKARHPRANARAQLLGGALFWGLRSCEDTYVRPGEKKKTPIQVKDLVDAAPDCFI
ncbi:hypothetical protein THAOC_11554, partial [Thalassiosira oceanica]